MTMTALAAGRATHMGNKKRTPRAAQCSIRAITAPMRFSSTRSSTRYARRALLTARPVLVLSESSDRDNKLCPRRRALVILLSWRVSPGTIVTAVARYRRRAVCKTHVRSCGVTMILKLVTSAATTSSRSHPLSKRGGCAAGVVYGIQGGIACHCPPACFHIHSQHITGRHSDMRLNGRSNGKA